MDLKEKGKLLIQLNKIDRDVRGAFILQTVTMDYLITDILSAHFSSDPEKHNQLYSLVIMPELNFRTKIKIFSKVLNKHYPKVYENEKYKDLFPSLEKIRKFRNRVAHAMLDTSEELLEKRQLDRIQFFFYEDGQKKTQVIKKDEFRERLIECSKAIVKIAEIQDVVKGS